ncbi:hypothetical protein [Nonomuraea dietziae]|uniref:Secreted protein n=1 Tax=Nonomuraea dietziae TaxID=65515 RepID=A0A7W5VD99_9ACTN|nr:hypothetical protein [Nonomuraea dietziae]MBB3725552.1 hypothetical protein [Nonomuraea dietziae]
MKLRHFAAASAAIALALVTASATPASAGSSTCWLNGDATCTSGSVPATKGYIIAKLAGDVKGTVWDTINNVSVGSFSCDRTTRPCVKTISGLTHRYKIIVKADWDNIWNNGWGSVQDA